MKVNDFDPEKVPSVGQLLGELDSLGREGLEDGTSLGQSSGATIAGADMSEPARLGAYEPQAICGNVR